MKVDLNRQEINDLISALHYFCEAYPDEGATVTKAAMGKLTGKLWKVLRNES